ncbi:[NiFe]-hydrogenase assembly chaperone HybE [Burkholderia vietnamiensis]|uniref:[NiFe]-hydrogenase assembly chaperone HybE n=1 Tax=Burkholderia vietnamiensis TaxID=60552 RepID=UPI0009BD126B|nr:[NiFe]-hydrogenase assembly chaperone HybE [Burkholderia vietnamiensis]MBH9644072.1 [NiFe]-hydrogenase assembly chaperone HybE [Burkholderia vietnamiensis]HDR8918931.1 [NiFe]-hydrogenase assembly chaperone HybE [Burkholderia vietnamiensis]HDR8977219.1 [NiFe]-hydrogenase assembly chaperone HybE [Burkholderia vietnamiensis]HDR9086254.1 [NiFe]-hydrogenase assembly chaperone HybE [Burkholderia vietnamiensis]HDR9180780.1 [NiFe]-hydrogenase assembly chaperone HybE [Burkholderia vietnamiensis]
MTTRSPTRDGDALRASLPGGSSDPRIGALVAHYTTVAATTMLGMPVVHPGLRVEAVAFGPYPAGGDASGDLLGILVTPWFMNLVWLPGANGAAQPCPSPGQLAARRVGAVEFDWIGAHVPQAGAHACCSLFSPMFDFSDHASAVATARAVLAQLRSAAADAPPRTSRRAFLLRRPATREAGA